MLAVGQFLQFHNVFISYLKFCWTVRIRVMMLTHIEPPFDGLLVRISIEFIVVFIISTADYSFGLLILISTVRKTKKSLKN